MRSASLPRQAIRTIHTPAIFDSGAPPTETRASVGVAESTPANEAVHVRGPIAWQPNAGAASRIGSRQ